MPMPDSHKSNPPDRPERPKKPLNQLSIAHFDLSKRYDIYCWTANQERLFENVRLAIMRTFNRGIGGMSFSYGDYLELEAGDTSKIVVPIEVDPILWTKKGPS